MVTRNLLDPTQSGSGDQSYNTGDTGLQFDVDPGMIYTLPDLDPVTPNPDADTFFQEELTDTGFDSTFGDEPLPGDFGSETFQDPQISTINYTNEEGKTVSLRASNSKELNEEAKNFIKKNIINSYNPLILTLNNYKYQKQKLQERIDSGRYRSREVEYRNEIKGFDQLIENTRKQLEDISSTTISFMKNYIANDSYDGEFSNKRDGSFDPTAFDKFLGESQLEAQGLDKAERANILNKIDEIADDGAVTKEGIAATLIAKSLGFGKAVGWYKDVVTTNALINMVEQGVKFVLGKDINLPNIPNPTQVAAKIIDNYFRVDVKDENGNPIIDSDTGKVQTKGLLENATGLAVENIPFLKKKDGTIAPTEDLIFDDPNFKGTIGETLKNTLEDSLIGDNQTILKTNFDDIKIEAPKGKIQSSLQFVKNVFNNIGFTANKIAGNIVGQQIVNQAFDSVVPGIPKEIFGYGNVLDIVGDVFGPKKREDIVRVLQNKNIDIENMTAGDVSLTAAGLEKILGEEIGNNLSQGDLNKLFEDNKFFNKLGFKDNKTLAEITAESLDNFAKNDLDIDIAKGDSNLDLLFSNALKNKYIEQYGVDSLNDQNINESNTLQIGDIELTPSTIKTLTTNVADFDNDGILNYLDAAPNDWTNGNTIYSLNDTSDFIQSGQAPEDVQDLINASPDDLIDLYGQNLKEGEVYNEVLIKGNDNVYRMPDFVVQANDDEKYDFLFNINKQFREDEENINVDDWYNRNFEEAYLKENSKQGVPDSEKKEKILSKIDPLNMWQGGAKGLARRVYNGEITLDEVQEYVGGLSTSELASYGYLEYNGLIDGSHSYSNPNNMDIFRDVNDFYNRLYDYDMALSEAEANEADTGDTSGYNKFDPSSSEYIPDPYNEDLNPYELTTRDYDPSIYKLPDFEVVADDEPDVTIEDFPTDIVDDPIEFADEIQDRPDDPIDDLPIVNIPEQVVTPGGLTDQEISEAEDVAAIQNIDETLDPITDPGEIQVAPSDLISESIATPAPPEEVIEEEIDMDDTIDDVAEVDEQVIGSGVINEDLSLDAAYNTARLLVGDEAALKYKGKGLANPEYQSLINSFLLDQAQDAFAINESLAEDSQRVADKQRRLRRSSDLDLLGEFADPYQEQLREMYPTGAMALEELTDIAQRKALEAEGGLTPRQQAEAEQIGYFDVAAKGRQRDAVAIASAFEAQSDVKRQRDADAQNSLVNAFNLERNFYGDIPSYLIGDSPFVEGIGSVSPATNFSSILDVANVDFANQARFQQAQETLAQLRQDYASAQASGQVDKATQLQYDILKLQNNIQAFTTGAQFLGDLPEIIQDTGQAIGGGIQNLLGLVGIKSSPVGEKPIGEREVDLGMLTQINKDLNISDLLD